MLLPDEDTFERVREDHWREGGFFDVLLDKIELPDTGKIIPAMGEVAIAQALQNLGSDYGRGFSDGASWSLSHIRQQVEGPENYKFVPPRFVGLVLGHEIGSHLLEYVNGSRSAVRLTARGLDRTEMGNEGTAIVPEQVVYKSMREFTKLLRWQDIVRRDLAVALGTGFDGQRRSFPEVYAIINAVDRLWERAKKPDDPEAADAKANDRTWVLLATRTQKGTDGTGGAYYKDKGYLEGNVGAWHAEMQRPGSISLSRHGKFDITNARHLDLLQGKGVLPAEI